MTYKFTSEESAELHADAATGGETWWEITAWNAGHRVAFGTAEEAEKYCNCLNSNRDVNLFAARRVTDAADLLRLDNGEDTDVFRLDLALDTLAEQADWRTKGEA